MKKRKKNEKREFLEKELGLDFEKILKEQLRGIKLRKRKLRSLLKRKKLTVREVIQITKELREQDKFWLEWLEKMDAIKQKITHETKKIIYRWEVYDPVRKPEDIAKAAKISPKMFPITVPSESREVYDPVRKSRDQNKDNEKDKHSKTKTDSSEEKVQS